jgi:SAM-dependent methyltransferase
MGHYALENTAIETGGRFDALSAVYDPVTFDALSRTGVRGGWRCLEVGGGGGTVAAWLAGRVGYDGCVTVTDIDPHWMLDLDRHSNIELLRHDIVRDPPPGTGFDLVHARLVLLHLPQRAEVVVKLARCLRPGGWLVIEDFDCDWVPVLSAPDAESEGLFTAVHAAFLDVLRAADADPGWGSKIYSAMRRAGLEMITTATYTEAWRGGGVGTSLHRANIAQVAGKLKERGIGDDQIGRFQALLDDPEFVVNSYPMVTASGCVPR